MIRTPHAKSAILALIGAAVTLLMFYPLIAAAQYEEKPQQFINYEKFRKPPKTESLDLRKPKPVGKPLIRLETTKQSYSGRHYSKEEVIQLIIDYSEQYGIAPDTALCIAKLESGYNQFSKNKKSTASGVFQYLASTWKVTDQGKIGLSVFDADANVKAAVSYMAVHKNTRPWTIAPQCPKLQFINPT